MKNYYHKDLKYSYNIIKFIIKFKVHFDNLVYSFQTKMAESKKEEEKVSRDCSQPISIHSDWKWKGDFAIFSTDLKGITFEEIEKLVFCSLGEYKDKIENFRCYSQHYNLMKVLSFKIDKKQIDIIQQENGFLEVEVDDEPMKIISNEEMIEYINKMWDAKTEQEFLQIIKGKLKETWRQFYLIVQFALNNSIIKATKDQIIYI